MSGQKWVVCKPPTEAEAGYVSPPFPTREAAMQSLVKFFNQITADYKGGGFFIFETGNN